MRADEASWTRVDLIGSRLATGSDTGREGGRQKTYTAGTAGTDLIWKTVLCSEITKENGRLDHLDSTV